MITAGRSRFSESKEYSDPSGIGISNDGARNPAINGCASSAVAATRSYTPADVFSKESAEHPIVRKTNRVTPDWIERTGLIGMGIFRRGGNQEEYSLRHICLLLVDEFWLLFHILRISVGTTIFLSVYPTHFFTNTDALIRFAPRRCY